MPGVAGPKNIYNISPFGIDGNLLQIPSLLSPFDINSKGKNRADGNTPPIMLNIINMI